MQWPWTRWVGIAVGLAWALVGLSSAGASAQAAERPTATILTAQLTGVAPGDGAAFDRTVRARIDALGVVRTEGAVALDLEQIQLAIGCMGETAECLSMIATETSSQIIVVPSLARSGETTVATILVFDARDQSLRRGTRETPSADSSALLGGVEGLLREVFGLPPVAAVEQGDDAQPPATTAHAGLSAAPVVVLTIGGVALIVGAILGGISMGDASTYQGMTFHTAADVDTGLGLLSRQQTEAVAADGLLIGGGVVAVAGLIWLLAAGNEDGSSPLAMTPIVSSTQVGLAVSGSFGGAL